MASRHHTQENNDSLRNAHVTAVDWASHRDLITRLYWDEDRSLKEVRELMRLDHGFNAT
jgi:hypothetical protein